MTETETLDRARLLFVGDTQGDRLAREVIGIAEIAMEQRDKLQGLLAPLRDAALFARSQRRPMGIGQDHSRAVDCVQIQLGAEYGRERDCVGFWIDSPQIDSARDMYPASVCDSVPFQLAVGLDAAPEITEEQIGEEMKRLIVEREREARQFEVVASGLRSNTITLSTPVRYATETPVIKPRSKRGQRVRRWR